MVSFHHDSQRLAVGTQIGPIAIYDIRTTAKWRVLDGIKGRVTCIQFNPTGHYLASYSNDDKTLRLWKVGNTGFFSGIMGIQAKCAKMI
jgi:WD40 repeat protein